MAASAWGKHWLPLIGRRIDLLSLMVYDLVSDRLNGDKELKFEIELDREADGRWIAEITSLPGAMAYGKTKPEAVAKVKAIALRMLADQIEKEKKSKPLDVSITCCR